MSRGAVEHYPAKLTPVDEDGHRRGPDVEVYQLRPGEQHEAITWSGLEGHLLADAGVLLVDDGAVVAQVRLGDVLIRDGQALRVETEAGRLFATHRLRAP